MLKLSIVMCVFQNLHLTMQSVENLLNTDVPFELIVIDNGCTDGTAAYLEKRPVKVITNKLNRSIMPAWNQGLEAADGDFVMFTCNDMIVHHSNAQKMLEVFKVDPSVYCVTTEFTHLAYPQDWWEQAARKLAEPLTFKLVGPPMPPNPPDDQMMGGHFIVSREGLNALGKFDEWLPIWYSDVDIWCRFRAMGHPVVQANTLIHHFESQTTGASFPEANTDLTIEESHRRFEAKWGKCADVIADYHANPMPVV
jgi:GT2 family glycosyltransferase